MPTTFVLPTYVADGAIVTGAIRAPAYTADGTFITGNVFLPTFVCDGSLVPVGLKMPVYTPAARTNFFVPSYVAGLIYYVHVPTGGVLVGGAAAVVGDPFIPTGGVRVGGTAPVTHNIAFAPTGGVKVGGSAVVSSLSVNIFNIADDGVPSGGVQVGGAALIQDNLPWIPSGGVKVGGGAIIQESINYIPSGGVQIGGTVGVSSVLNVTPTGGVQIGGSAPVAVGYAIVPTGGVQIGGSAVVRDYQAFFAPSGGVKIGGAALAYMIPSHIVTTTENPYGDAFPGWAVNFETSAVSRYLGLAANSMALFGGRTFVSNAGGIYEIGADDDAGQPIHASIDPFGTTDFQNSHDKRMEVAYVGVKTTGRMRLRLSVNGKEPMYYFLMPNSATPKGTRVPIGKGLVGRYWNVRLDNIDGGDFELESAEFNPIAGQRHGA